jgi:histidyl-tRNA synthetase
VLVTKFDDVPFAEYTSIATSLRENGIQCSTYIGAKKFDKQIDYAVKDNYSHVIIMGTSELEGGVVKIKDLRTREESTVARAELCDYFKNA